MRKLIRAATLCGVVFAATATPATAATTVGETFDPPPFACPGGWTFLQTASPPSNAYLVPSPGVITSWSHHADASPATHMRLKLARGTEPNYTIAAQSNLENLSPGLNTFPARLPVQAGDILGLYITTDGECGRNAPSDWVDHYFFGDPGVGETKGYEGETGLQLNVSARLEADADADGFGDETQDECPTDAVKQLECDPPETVITKEAPNKTDKTKVKFKFASDEPEATFECKVDKESFKACTSPRTVKRLTEGKHKFQVRAIDAAGNSDPTADKDKFKVTN